MTRRLDELLLREATHSGLLSRVDSLHEWRRLHQRLLDSLKLLLFVGGGVVVGCLHLHLSRLHLLLYGFQDFIAVLGLRTVYCFVRLEVGRMDLGLGVPVVTL